LPPWQNRAAVRFGLPLQLPSPDDMALLTDYAWPGNVRELAAVIDRAAILGQGAGLEVAKALGVTPGIGAAVAADGRSAARPSATPVALDAVIKQHIEATLRATRGRIEGPYGAARLLQVNPHTLRGKMRKLGIAWNTFRAAQST
jgi:DNA-binding NtrC family response regulator